MSRASAFPRQPAQPIEHRRIVAGFKNCPKLLPNQWKASKQRLHKACRNTSVQALEERTAVVFLVGPCDVTYLGSQHVRFVTVISCSSAIPSLPEIAAASHVPRMAFRAGVQSPSYAPRRAGCEQWRCAQSLERWPERSRRRAKCQRFGARANRKVEAPPHV